MSADRGQTPPASRTEYVLERLREDITSGTVSPGESLRQTDLAERYGVSATPVREALRRLEAEGSVRYLPHKGATVAHLDPERTQDLYLLRAATESLATRVAVERMEDGAADALRELHEDIVGAVGQTSGRTLSRLNRELHFALYELGSELIDTHLETQWRLFPPTVTLWEDLDTARLFCRQHGDILDAVDERDPEKASRLMSDHVMTAARRRRESRG